MAVAAVRAAQRFVASATTVFSVLLLPLPGRGAPPRTHEDFLTLSLQHYQAKRYEESIAAARQALALKPDYDRAYNNICAAYNALARWDEAIEAGEAALRLNPGNSLAANNLAWSRKMKASRPPLAVAPVAPAGGAPGDGRDGARAAPAAPPGGSKSAEDLLGQSLRLYKAGQFEKSVEAATEALKLRPDYGSAYNNICAARNALGQWDLAIVACEKAVALDPGSELARNNLAVARRGKSPLTGLWDEFWSVVYLTPHTVNLIDVPRFRSVSFLVPLYGLIAVLTAAGFLVLRSRGSGGLLQAFLLACAVGGVLFAARMDFTWLKWWERDARLLAPLDIAGRLSVLEADNVHGFAEELKKIIPSTAGVRLYTGDEEGDRSGVRPGEGVSIFRPYYKGKIKYHLLPLKLSERSPYIAVFRDRRVHLDPADRRLKEGAAVLAENVIVVKDFGNDTSLYKAEGTGGAR